jgi:sulfite exporter TauE/SafE
VNLLLAPFQSPVSLVAFGISTLAVVLMIGIMFKSVLTTEGRSKWARRITNVNAKFLFTFLAIGWAVVFGVGLQLVPHTGANSPYGALGLIALFSGFFIMMGLLWSVIGE